MLTLREIRYQVVEPGRRTRVIEVISTLTDAEQYTREQIAQLCGFRWNSELDLRSIKAALNLGHVRCKSPEMVRRELGTTLLAYKPDPHHSGRRGVAPRQTAASDQFHGHVPVRAGVLDGVFLWADSRGATHRVCPRHAPPDRDP